MEVQQVNLQPQTYQQLIASSLIQQNIDQQPNPTSVAFPFALTQINLTPPTDSQSTISSSSPTIKEAPLTDDSTDSFSKAFSSNSDHFEALPSKTIEPSIIVSPIDFKIDFSLPNSELNALFYPVHQVEKEYGLVALSHHRFFSLIKPGYSLYIFDLPPLSDEQTMSKIIFYVNGENVFPLYFFTIRSKDEQSFVRFYHMLILCIRKQLHLDPNEISCELNPQIVINFKSSFPNSYIRCTKRRLFEFVCSRLCSLESAQQHAISNDVVLFARSLVDFSLARNRHCLQEYPQFRLNFQKLFSSEVFIELEEICQNELFQQFGQYPSEYLCEATHLEQFQPTVGILEKCFDASKYIFGKSFGKNNFR